MLLVLPSPQGVTQHRKCKISIPLVQEIFVPIVLTFAQELTENNDFEGRSMEKGWVKQFVSWSGRHTTPEGSNWILLVQEIFVPPIFLTIAQELTENDDFDGGENGEWGWGSDRSTVSARFHTTPEGPKLFVPPKNNSPRIHQEWCLQRGEGGGELMVMGWGKWQGFFLEPCSNPRVGQKRWLCQKYYYDRRSTTMTKVLLWPKY